MDDDTELDHDVLKDGKVFLSVTENYTPGWKAKDAFREIYQNWRDGICASFNVDPRSITPEVDTDCREGIQIAVRMCIPGIPWSNKKRLLGYIRFNQRTGALEVTNFKAKLEKRHLYLGESTKRNNNALAGGHGEGFKLAALVLLRNGYAVKLETNSFYWNFSLSKAAPQTLICRLSQPKPGVLEKKTNDYNACTWAYDFERGLTSNMWEDVTFLIGHRRGPNTNNRISREDFESWLLVALELHPPQPADIVRTAEGDLILDPKFASKIYLHGLYVSKHSPNGKPYRYGYNFHYGAMNRDRERLTDPSEEARMVASIWAAAIASRGDAVTDAYIQLFQVLQNPPPDILETDDYVSRITAAQLLGRMKQCEPDAFFYTERNATESNGIRDEDIIAKDLRKQPRKLEKALWKVLRKYNLVRTPLEERKHLFTKSPEVEPYVNSFGANIARALRGFFNLHEDLKLIKIHYIAGGDTNIDVLYTDENKTLRVHARWLDYARAHAGTACEYFRAMQEQAEDDRAFFCDHIVQYLLDCAIEEVRTPLGLALDEALPFKRDAMECFRQMPRIVKVAPVTDKTELEVSWNGNENSFFAENYERRIFYQVCLHNAASCQDKINSILNLSGEDTDRPREHEMDSTSANGSCGCLTRVVSQADSKVSFTGLDYKQSYFAMVSRARLPSFYGPPPAPVAPNKHRRNRPTTTPHASIERSALRSRFQVPAPTPTPEHHLPEAERSSPSPSPDPGFAFDTRADSSKQDEKVWETWHHENLEAAFSCLLPGRLHTQVKGEPIDSIEYLDCLFERHQYVRLRLADEATELIVYIHDICQNNDDFEDPTYILSFIRFVPLSQVFPFQQVLENRDRINRDKEVVLYFDQQNKMGTAEDAESVFLDTIVSAQDIGSGANGMQYVLPDHSGPLRKAFFCRYGIRKDGRDKAVSITPVASYLLQANEKWPIYAFDFEQAPLCMELSPQVIGPAEGFAQAGYAIQAAFGINTEKHSTWMKRHAQSKIFDGPVACIFDDMKAGKLLPPMIPSPAPARVAFIAGQHPVFRIAAENQSLPTLQDFAEPFRTVQEIFERSTKDTKPDIVVIFMPAAVLHPLALQTAAQAMTDLLKRRFAIHLRLLSPSEYGLPQRRSFLVIIGIPLCKPLQCAITSPRIQDLTSIKDVMQDLAFGNTRTTPGSTTGLVCSPPEQEGTEAGSTTTRYVYNHQDRSPVPHARTVVIFEGVAGHMLDASKPLELADRHGELTVREVARIQGIPDDLVFCGSLNTQYETVYKAIPPVLAKSVAEAILRMLRSSTVKKVGQLNTVRRPKRVKVEDNVADEQ